MLLFHHVLLRVLKVDSIIIIFHLIELYVDGKCMFSFLPVFIVRRTC